MRTKLRTGVVIGKPLPAETMGQIAAGTAPRPDFLRIQQLSGSDLLSADRTSWLARFVKDHRLLAAFSVIARRRQYDALFITGEDIGIRLAPLLRLFGWRGRLIVVVHAVRSAKWKTVLRLIGSRLFSDVAVVSAAQRQILVDEAGFQPDRVHLMSDSVDLQFFQPSPEPPDDYVFACGLENRDYATLLQAAGLLPFQFRIAASGFFGSGQQSDAAPDNVEMLRTRLPWPDLRTMYAKARFVVVPLHPVDYAAGINGLMEAMAMGKAAIVTASPGIAEYLESAAPGPVVPAGDPAALAAAITTLWNDPASCADLGRRNRDWIAAHGSVDEYAQTLADMLRSRQTG